MGRVYEKYSIVSEKLKKIKCQGHDERFSFRVKKMVSERGSWLISIQSIGGQQRSQETEGI